MHPFICMCLCEIKIQPGITLKKIEKKEQEASGDVIFKGDEMVYWC